MKASFDNILDFVEIREVNVSLQRNVYYIMYGMVIWEYQLFSLNFSCREVHKSTFTGFLQVSSLHGAIYRNYLYTPNKLLIGMLIIHQSRKYRKKHSMDRESAKMITTKIIIYFWTFVSLHLNLTERNHTSLSCNIAYGCQYENHEIIIRINIGVIT